MVVSHNFQENKHIFPLLYHIVLDVLLVQASSVPCERVFSSRKDTDMAPRNSMLRKMLEVFQVLNFVFRGSDFHSGTSYSNVIPSKECLNHWKLNPSQKAYRAAGSV